MTINTKQLGPWVKATITFPRSLCDENGCYRFEAAGEDIPHAIYLAAKHAHESIVRRVEQKETKP